MLVAVTVQATPSGASTHDAIIAGMKCQQNSLSKMECHYRVGRSLYFIITGVGDEDVSISFFASSFEGDYYGVVGLTHDCVVVTPGEAIKGPEVFDFGFVSPRTGKAYRD